MAETQTAKTDERSGTELLKRFIDNGFDSDTDKAALALGRTSEELRDMLEGKMVVDEDLEMKIRGIADERGFEI